jgi:hypothetical protein
MTTLQEALAILDLTPGQSIADARVRYREILRRVHPDVAAEGISSASATTETIAITEAFGVVRDAVAANDGRHIPRPSPERSEGNSREPDCRHRERPAGPMEAVEIRTDGDTLFITAPPAEAFGLLLDACARLGGIGYVDRNLGLLEVIVRFEGGPSCSVLLTLQGRAFGTDAFVTMESIEAAPTPALAPVVEALLEELAAVHPN